MKKTIENMKRIPAEGTNLVFEKIHLKDSEGNVIRRTFRSAHILRKATTKTTTATERQQNCETKMLPDLGWKINSKEHPPSYPSNQTISLKKGKEK